MKSAALSGSVDMYQRIQDTLSELRSLDGVQELTLTPSAVSDTKVLRYSAPVSATANTFFGVICPEPADVLVFTAAGPAWPTKTTEAHTVAPASLAAAHLPLQPSEQLYFEIWQNGSRCFDEKYQFRVLVAECA